MTQDVEHLLQRLFSETLTDTNTEVSISLQLRVCTQGSLYMLGLKHPCQWAISYQSTNSLKEQLFQIVKLKLEIEDLSQEQVAPQLLSLVTLMTELRLESGYLVVAEEAFQDTAEQWLALLLEEAELINQSVKLETNTTNTKQNVGVGLLLEVLL